MKLIKKVIRRVLSVFFKTIESIKPFIQKRYYLGYILYYSKGTSLVERIKKKNSIYEPEVCNFIVDSIKNLKNPNVIDVGSNIGLISLFIIKNVPKVKVFAFEPGPHQNMLLKKTIEQNNLNNSLELFDYALSDKSGEATFCVHNTRDVSGDGFIDTNRAGTSTEIAVKTKRLDEWWEEKGKPQIDMIKIDTEGAELWVLKGAHELINTCKPYIITEINKINYRNYPYGENEVLDLLWDYNYLVYNENRVLTDKSNIDFFQNEGIDTYFCEPKI